MLSKYLKAAVAVVGGAVTVGLGLGLHGTIQQVLTAIAGVLTAFGVYRVPNAKGPAPVTVAPAPTKPAV